MLTALILSVLLPAAVAVALLAVGYRAWRTDSAADGTWALAVIAPAGAISAHAVLREVPDLPPGDANLWPLWTGVAVAAVVIARERLALSAWAGAALASVASLATAGLVCAPLVESTWTTGQTALGISASALAMTTVWSSLDRRTARVEGPGGPVALAGLVGAAAAVLGLSGTALLAQTLGGAAAALGAAALVGLRRPRLVARAAVGPAVILAGGMLLGGTLYAEVSLTILAVFSAGALAVGLLPLPGLAAGGLRAAASLTAVVMLATGAVAGATMLSAEDPTVATGAANTEAAADDDDYGYED